jgi:hypothetical protein
MANEKFCGNCEHWDYQDKEDGICRRHAPAPAVVPNGSGYALVEPMRHNKNKACGEFKRAK